jgi:hypothetical protein
MGFNLGHFIKDAASTAGHVLGAPAGLIIKGTEEISKVASKIPVIGPAFHAVFGLADEPFKLEHSILSGERIDKAFVDSFKRQIADIKEVAPYAQAVVSFVPGIGTAASMAIGAGLAIASGRPIDEVAMAAVSGAIPGGPIVSAAYNVGRTAIISHRIEDLGALASAVGQAAGVPIPAEASAALTGGLHVLGAMANGVKPDRALLQSAINAIPDIAKNVNLSTITQKGALDVADDLVAKGQELIPKLSEEQRKALKTALHTGIAMQHALNIQNSQHAIVATGRPIQVLARVGYAKLATDNVIQAARESLRGIGVYGFDVGVGTMHHQSTPYQITLVRSKLTLIDQHGFDVATALHIGRVIAPLLPSVSHSFGTDGAVTTAPITITSTPGAQAGYAITQGLISSNDPEHRVALMKTAASNKDSRHGAAFAASEIHAQKQGIFAQIWHAFRALLGLENKAKIAFFKAGDRLAAGRK